MRALSRVTKRLFWLPVVGSATLGGCWYDKFTKVDEVDDGTGGSDPGSGGEGGTDGMGGDTSTGGTVMTDVAVAADDADVTVQGDDILVDLLANDTGPGISFVSVDDTDPNRPSAMDAATFSVSSRGVLSFEPAPDFWGTYRATYVIEDENGEESTANIEIHVIPRAISLASIEAGWGGFIVQGAPGDFFGSSIAGVGDTNGDGVDDFLVGAPGAVADVAGRVALVLGKADIQNLDLVQSDIADHVQIFAGPGDAHTFRAGVSVARAGRVNDDALSDVIIGASRTAQNGRAYVLFGNEDFPTAPITLADSPSVDVGFTLLGPPARTGAAVSGGHDLNDDGKDDVVVYQQDTGNVMADFDASSGTAAAEADLVCTTATNAPTLAVVGDLFDADGRAEVLTGTTTEVILLRGADAWPVDVSGALTLAEGWEATTTIVPAVTALGPFDGNDTPDLAYCHSNNACRIVPTTATAAEYVFDAGWDIEGFSAGPPRLSGGGDVNADGLFDAIFAEDTQGYVVFGRATLPAAPVDVSALSNEGFSISPNGATISRVAIIGDVNDDGLADYALTVPTHNTDAGRVYVLFGTRTSVD